MGPRAGPASWPGAAGWGEGGEGLQHPPGPPEPGLQPWVLEDRTKVGCCPPPPPPPPRGAASLRRQEEVSPVMGTVEEILSLKKPCDS